MYFLFWNKNNHRWMHCSYKHHWSFASILSVTQVRVCSCSIILVRYIAIHWVISYKCFPGFGIELPHFKVRITFFSPLEWSSILIFHHENWKVRIIWNWVKILLCLYKNKVLMSNVRNCCETEKWVECDMG